MHGFTGTIQMHLIDKIRKVQRDESGIINR